MQLKFVLFYLPFVIAAGAIVAGYIHIHGHRKQLRIEEESLQKLKP